MGAETSYNPAGIYKFSAYKGSNQSLTAASTTKLTFDTEEFDAGGAYNAATSTFTTQLAAKYAFNCTVLFTDAAATVALYLYKNGTQFKRLDQGGFADGSMVGGIAIVDAAVSDTWEIYMFSDQNVTVVGASTTTYFQGWQIP